MLIPDKIYFNLYKFDLKHRWLFFLGYLSLFSGTMLVMLIPMSLFGDLAILPSLAIVIVIMYDLALISSKFMEFEDIIIHDVLKFDSNSAVKVYHGKHYMVQSPVKITG
jgi:hypothetical protein